MASQPGLFAFGGTPSLAQIGLGAAAVIATAATGLYLSVRGPSSRAGIPERMKQIQVTKYCSDAKGADLRDNFQLADVATPVPKPGQILVRMERAPINPSDLGPVFGRGHRPPPLPASLGLEGCGTVVQSGGGIMGWRVLGKRVAVISQAGGQTWSEYVVVPALVAVVLPKEVSWDQGASCFVNPLTVIAFVQIAKQYKKKVILHTAAASSLGKMLVRLARRNGIEVIGVVRKESQKRELMEQEGVRHVINTADEKWEDQLVSLTKDLKCTLAFDAIAGAMSGTLVRCLPNESKIYVYGALDKAPVSGIPPLDLMYNGKEFHGFVLPRYLAKLGLLGQKKMMDLMVARLTDDLRSPIAARYPLAETAAALQQYLGNMSDGKILIAPTLTVADRGVKK